MSDNAPKYCMACCCCSALIVGIILFAISFSVLEATEMGLDYSSVGKNINADILYESGRHMLGVGHSFKKYPKDQQSTKFPDEAYGPLQARTIDGLGVVLEVQYQFRLNADLESIVRIYYDWGLRYEEAYAIVARNILRDIASNWTAYEFFYNRTEIEATMQLELQSRIEKDGGMLDDLQLLDITLPEQFESELTKTESIRQEIEQVEFDVQDAVVRAANKRKRMFDEAKVITNQKLVEAQKMLNEKTAARRRLEESLSAEVESFQAIKLSTNLTSTNMYNYIWLQNLADGEINFLKAQKPTEIHCYADPYDAACPTAFSDASQSFSCTSGNNCVLVVAGSNMKHDDRLRLATDSTCATKHAAAGAESFTANVGPSATQKVFAVGNVGVAATMTVCFCKYSFHAQGCDWSMLGTALPAGLQAAFTEIGTLTVS